MLKTIIKREILEYLKSAKFVSGLLITVILTTVSTAINVQDYTMRHQDYLDAKKELKSNGFEISMFREPQVLSTLVRGKDRDLGNFLKFSVMNIPSRLTGYQDVEQRKYPSFSGFPAVDFAFLVRVVLGLMVVFLAYNAVSEEKSNGTLKLVMANALPRDKLLLGKLVSGLAVVLSSLLISAILAFLILLFHRAVSLSGADGLRIAGMMAVSALYLSVFYALGLFISVKADRPATALMILLQTWIFLVIIYPNLSVTLAEHLCPLPSEEALQRQYSAVYQKYSDAMKRANEAFDKNPRQFVEIWSTIAAENRKIDQEFARRQTQQMKWAEFLSALSPAPLYDQVMNRLARTDVREYERFMEGVNRLWQKHVERSRLRYTDPEAYKKTVLPDFSYRSDSAVDSLAATWPQGLVLLLFSLILFVLAYTGFLRKDLR